MIFVRVKDSDVLEIHYQPFDPVYGLGKTEEELLKEGILVDSVPEPEYIEGKASVLKYDQAEGKLYYEYEDIPLTGEALLEQKVKQLEEQLRITQEAIDALLLG